MQQLIQKKCEIAVPLILLGCFTAPLLIILIDIYQHIVINPNILLYFCSFSFLKKLYNSILLSTTVAGVSVISGAIFAYLFFGLKHSWQRSGMLFLMLVVLSISPIIYLVALTRFSLFYQLPVFWQSVTVLTINMSPLPFAIFIFTIGAINTSSLDAAFLSASPGSVYRHIILPQLCFPISIAGLIIFMFVFSHQEVPSFLGYRTYAEEFLSRIVLMTDLGEASVWALPFLLLGCGVVTLLTWLVSKTHLYYLFSHSYKPLSFTIQSSKIVLLVSFVFLAFLLFGTFATLMRNINVASLSLAVADNFEPTQISLLLSVISGILGTACACQLYCFFSRGHNRFIAFLGVTILLLYWLIPSSLTSLGLIGLTHFLSINSTLYDLVILLFGYQIKLLPLGVLVLASVQMVKKEPDNNVTELLDVSRANIFTKLIFPTHWPKWLLTGTILAIFALNDLSTTILLVPPGVETIVIKIYNLMHYGDYSLVSFLSLIQILLVSTIVLLTATIIKFYDNA
jgi:iron(III) transport system permease protein